jgi:predicted  nucleic acid-binding Zn-ribbon protein
MAGKKTFQCLRCDHRFPVNYDPKQVVERACPKCGSNSVRLEPATAAGQGART